MHNGRSKSSKVVDFGTNRKRQCDFLLVINSNRFWDMATYWPKSANFSCPTLIQRPHSGWTLWNCWMIKTSVLMLSVGEDFLILAWVVLTQCQRVTDGRTDRRTCRRQLVQDSTCQAMLTPCVHPVPWWESTRLRRARFPLQLLILRSRFVAPLITSDFLLYILLSSAYCDAQKLFSVWVYYERYHKRRSSVNFGGQLQLARHFCPKICMKI